MSEIKMRTRLLSKMTNAEVEKYLDRNSIIFVPVGTVELSGQMPMDAEYTSPAGIALACAEKVDGLVMDGLKYFYTGGTSVGRGAVQVSTRAGYKYLKEVLLSLWCQGFKEIITVSGHGPAEMTIVPCIWDFFDETKHHIWWMNCGPCQDYAQKRLDPAVHGVTEFSKVHLGCYEILGCRNELKVDPIHARPYAHWDAEPGKPLKGQKPVEMELPESVRYLMHANQFATFSNVTGFYFGSNEDHGGDMGAFLSEEAREAACVEGLKQLRVMVELMDMPGYISDIRKQQMYTDTEIKGKYRHLPKNRFADWN